MLMHYAATPEPPSPDRLGVLTTTLPVVLTAPGVILDGERIAAVAADWASQPWTTDQWDATLHFFDADRPEYTVNWMLLLDALNFCFWADPGKARWQFDTGQQRYNGYNALAAALTTAERSGYSLGEASFLANMDAATMHAIFRGEGEFIPLFDARLAHTREVGSVLLERFEGQFANAVTLVNGDAVALALLVADAFPSFRDVTTWEGQPVSIYKRAQILVADIAAAFGGEGFGAFHNLGELTAFADYKVPQLLRRLGMLDYAPDLAARIDREEEIAPDSPDEVAIRAATIWGVELLRRALAERGVRVTATAIDYRLWLAGQVPDPLDRPYHHTRTIFY